MYRKPVTPFCSPSAAKTAAAARVTAPAVAGQGEGTLHRLRPRRCIAAFAFRSARFRLMYLSPAIFTAVAMAPIKSASATALQTLEITSGGITLIESSLWDVVLLVVGCHVLGLTIFWLIVVPLHDWLVERFVGWFK